MLHLLKLHAANPNRHFSGSISPILGIFPVFTTHLSRHRRAKTPKRAAHTPKHIRFDRADSRITDFFLQIPGSYTVFRRIIGESLKGERAWPPGYRRHLRVPNADVKFIVALKPLSRALQPFETDVPIPRPCQPSQAHPRIGLFRAHNILHETLRRLKGTERNDTIRNHGDRFRLSRERFAHNQRTQNVTPHGPAG